MTTCTIRDVLTDPALFGGQFGGASWAAWRALLCAFYGLPLTPDERRTVLSITGRVKTPEQACRELWLVIGRRGGKSQAAALLAVFEAAFIDRRDRLAPGEVATVLVIAADRRQARTVVRYITGLLRSNPMLERLIVRATGEGIELANRTVIEVSAASFKSVRGYSIAAVIADELAFWRSDDSANPDREVIAALRPALATLDGKLVALSSPYARRGSLWDAHRRYFGKDDGAVLVAQAPSRTMNPSLPQHVVDDAMAEDAEAARAEYLAEFRSDLASFVDRAVVDGCVVPGRHELPFSSEIRYSAFVDPSGGSVDQMTLAIGHTEAKTVVVDAIRAVKPPFSPESVVKDFAELLATYRITKITGDRYGGEWPRERFSVHRVAYDPAAKPRSDLYRELLPLLNAGRIELPDHALLINQLCGLERRTARGGRDSIDHAPGQHDDVANAVAGLASILAATPESAYSQHLIAAMDMGKPQRPRPPSPIARYL